MSTITVTNVRVFDGEKVVEGQSSVSFSTSTELLTSEADGDSVFDGTGCTILPGLCDTHVHLFNPLPNAISMLLALSKDMVACGITTAVDCGKMSSEHFTILQREEIAPNILFTGNFATSTGSTHSKFSMADSSSIVDTVEAASVFVKARINEGAHFIKTVADIPGPSQEVINQLSKSAKEHGKMTIVHAARHAAFLMALNAEPPVSIITHAPMDKALTLDDAKLMKEKGIVSVPTLIMQKTLSASGFIPMISFPPASETVKVLRAANVPILVGTDSNQSTVSRVEHGKALWQEMELLEEASLQPAEILKGATQLSAQLLKVDDRGSIKPGKKADLVLVKGDPTADLQALKRVMRVWKAGKEIHNGLGDGAEGFDASKA